MFLEFNVRICYDFFVDYFASFDFCIGIYKRRIVIIKQDMNGISFVFSSVYIPKNELSKITHEINTLYYSKYKDKEYAVHRSLDLCNHYCIYYFENRGFNDYNTYEKIYDWEGT